MLNKICESVIAVPLILGLLRSFCGGTNLYQRSSRGGRAQVCNAQCNWISFAPFLILPVRGPFSDPGHSVMFFLLCLWRDHLMSAMPGTSTLWITAAVSERQKEQSYVTGKLLKVNTLCDYVDSFSSGKHIIFSPYHFPELKLYLLNINLKLYQRFWSSFSQNVRLELMLQ